jgi:hypothetical protein
MLRDQTSHFHHVRKRYEEENQRLVLKTTDMRDELLWYKVLEFKDQTVQSYWVLLP